MPESLINLPQRAESALIKVFNSTEPTLTAPQSILPTMEPVANSKEWLLNANYKDVIGGLTKLTQSKKDFLIFAIEGVQQVLDNGYAINPRVMIAQAVLESAYGTDSLSPYYNFFGIKAGKNSLSSVRVATREDYGSGLVSERHSFRTYTDPLGSFFDYADMIQRLDHYDDAVACRADDNNYVMALQNKLGEGCVVVRPQDEDDLKSYATARNYVPIVLDVIESLQLRDIYANT